MNPKNSHLFFGRLCSQRKRTSGAKWSSAAPGRSLVPTSGAMRSWFTFRLGTAGIFDRKLSLAANKHQALEILHVSNQHKYTIIKLYFKYFST